MNNYDVGDIVRLTATFTNSAGSNVDPSSLVLRHQIIRPWISNVTSVPYGVGSITKASTGSYFHDLQVNTFGELHYRFVATGDNAAAVEGKLQVLLPVVGS